jgi:hypothetical protein
VEIVTLSGKETMAALADCEGRGVRGGAVYDFLHLADARKAGVERVMTLMSATPGLCRALVPQLSRALSTAGSSLACRPGFQGEPPPFPPRIDLC